MVDNLAAILGLPVISRAVIGDGDDLIGQRVSLFLACACVHVAKRLVSSQPAVNCCPVWQVNISADVLEAFAVSYALTDDIGCLVAVIRWPSH